MKRILIVVALLCTPSVFARTPEHFFDSLAAHPNVPQASTPTVPPPPVLTPFDPTPIAAILGQQSAWTTWAQNSIVAVGAKVDGISAQVAAIPAGPAGPQGIPGIPGPQGPPGASAPASRVITVDASAFSAGSVPPRTEGGNCTPSTDIGWITAGQTVDYTVNVPAGNYILTACTASPSASASYRFEYPVGTSLGSTLGPLTNGWYTFRISTNGKVVALPGGPVVIRVVFETVNQNFGGFALTPQ